MHDGIFLINKPTGKTSNQVIQEIKQKLEINKIGHAGTLDPLATGLLVVLINNATKMSEYLLTADKAYDVEMRLFIETDTGDITGNVLNKTAPFKIQKKVLKKNFLMNLMDLCMNNIRPNILLLKLMVKNFTNMLAKIKK